MAKLVCGAETRKVLVARQRHGLCDTPFGAEREHMRDSDPSCAGIQEEMSKFPDFFASKNARQHLSLCAFLKCHEMQN